MSNWHFCSSRRIVLFLFFLQLFPLSTFRMSFTAAMNAARDESIMATQTVQQPIGLAALDGDGQPSVSHVKRSPAESASTKPKPKGLLYEKWLICAMVAVDLTQVVDIVYRELGQSAFELCRKKCRRVFRTLLTKFAVIPDACFHNATSTEWDIALINLRISVLWDHSQNNFLLDVIKTIDQTITDPRFGNNQGYGWGHGAHGSLFKGLYGTRRDPPQHNPKSIHSVDDPYGEKFDVCLCNSTMLISRLYSFPPGKYLKRWFDGKFQSVGRDFCTWPSFVNRIIPGDWKASRFRVIKKLACDSTYGFEMPPNAFDSIMYQSSTFKHDWSYTLGPVDSLLFPKDYSGNVAPLF